MRTYVLLNVAVLCFIVALALAQFGPDNAKLANWIGLYAGLLVLLALLPLWALARYAKWLVAGPPMLLILHALISRK